jgi:hypothetical protein
MIWTVWAILLITHGALARWAQTVRSFPLISLFADVLLIAIGLITIDQLQGLGFADILRIGFFFAAFGASGRQLMHGVLRKFGAEPLPRMGFF